MQGREEGGSATQLHPRVECYSTTHESFPVCDRFTSFTNVQTLYISEELTRLPISLCNVLEVFRILVSLSWR